MSSADPARGGGSDAPRHAAHRLAALDRVLQTELPITQSLGITAGPADQQGFTLRLPLTANRNHKGAVFAGSLNALATLTGWTVLWLELAAAGIDAHVVIQDSSIRYLRPMRTDATAFCAWPSREAIDHLDRLLRRRGRARLTLEVRVSDALGVESVRFTGRYVLMRRETA